MSDFISKINLNGKTYNIKASDASSPVTGVKGDKETKFRTGNVNLTPDNIGAIASTKIGIANGVASLGSDGKVPKSQLPSSLDDVLEFDTLSAFPAIGETGKIYVALNTGKIYRWGGTTYVVISETIALGETSKTAYRGDRGKIAYDHASKKGKSYNLAFLKFATNSEGHVIDAKAVTKEDIEKLGISGKDYAVPTLDTLPEIHSLAELWTIFESAMGSVSYMAMIRCKVVTNFGLGTGWFRLQLSEQNKVGNGTYNVCGTIIKDDGNGKIETYKVDGGAYGYSGLMLSRSYQCSVSGTKLILN